MQTIVEDGAASKRAGSPADLAARDIVTAGALQDLTGAVLGPAG